MRTRLISLVLGLSLSGSLSTRAENFSAEELNRRTLERRAVEAVIWAAAVNDDRMSAGGGLRERRRGPTRVIYWSRTA